MRFIIAVILGSIGLLLNSCLEPSDRVKAKQELFGEWRRVERFDDIEISSAEAQIVLRIYGTLDGALSVTGAVSAEITSITQFVSSWLWLPRGFYFYTDVEKGIQAPFLYVNTFSDSVYSSFHMCYDWLTGGCESYRPESELEISISFESGEMVIPRTTFYTEGKVDSIIIEGVFTLDTIELPAGEVILVETVSGVFSDLDPLSIEIDNVDEGCVEYGGTFSPGNFCGAWYISGGDFTLFTDDNDAPSFYTESYDLENDTLSFYMRPDCTPPEYSFMHEDFIIAQNPNVLTCCENTRLVYVRQ